MLKYFREGLGPYCRSCAPVPAWVPGPEASVIAGALWRYMLKLCPSLALEIWLIEPLFEPDRVLNALKDASCCWSNEKLFYTICGRGLFGKLPGSSFML